MTAHFAHASGGSAGRWGKNVEGFCGQIRRQNSKLLHKNGKERGISGGRNRVNVYDNIYMIIS